MIFMSNRDFNKKLAIALGAALGAGALNSVSVSAMEGNKQKKQNKTFIIRNLSPEDQERVNNTINEAFILALNVDDFSEAAKTKAKKTGNFKDLPAMKIGIPIRNLEKCLQYVTEQGGSLNFDQRNKIRRIVLNIGRYAIKEGYEIRDGKLYTRTNIFAGFPFNMVESLITIVKLVPMNVTNSPLILSTLLSMSDDPLKIRQIREEGLPELGEEYLETYYKNFQALENRIRDNYFIF